jgi:flagellar assembly factor FliW
LSLPSELPAGSVIVFPEGVPGFEAARRFVLLQHGEFEPVLLLQNVEDESLSLPVIPAQFVDPGYQLSVGARDRELLGFSGPPQPGGNVVCLLVLILAGREAGLKCNLFAPIVINPENMRGKQVMQIGSSYPSVFPLAGG